MITRRIYFSYIFSMVFSMGVCGAGLVFAAQEHAEIDAQKLYNKYCSTCHGDQGNGDTRAQNGLRPPPRDFTTVEAALELSRERMIDSVTNGRAGTAMIAHKDRLSSDQIAAVVDYIRRNFMRTPEDSIVVKNQRGKKLFTKNCSVCHGDKGNTAVWARSGLNPPPRDFTTAEARQILTRERMIKSVTNGRPGTGMMSFTTKLNAQDIEAVVDYIREAFMRVDKDNNPIQSESAAGGLPASPYENQAVLPRDSAHAGVTQQQAQQRAQISAQKMDPHANLAQRTNPHSGPHQGGMPAIAPQPMSVVDADMSLPFPNGFKGDPVKGREFFMGNCFTCHGVTGQGNGPRAYFNTPRPRNFTSETSRRILNRVRLFNGISNGRVGTVMPAWGKVLTDQEIANVAEFVFQAFVKPQDYPEISGIEPVNKEVAKKKAL